MTTTLRYTGPAALVSLLAQRLRENGGTVSFEPPEEGRGGPGEVAQAVVEIAVSGMTWDLIKATLSAVSERFPAVRVEPLDDQGHEDEEPPASL